MENKLIFSSIPIDELKEFIKQIVSNTNEELINKVVEKIPQEEVFTFEELSRFIKRKGPGARDVVIGYNIQPHAYDDKANPLYLKSEVIEAIKSGSPPKWFREKREEFLKRAVRSKQTLRDA